MSTELVVTVVLAALGSSGLWTLVDHLIARKDKRRGQAEQIRERQRAVNLALLHHLMYALCEKALLRGKIYVSEYDDLNHLAEQYFAEGGNGTGKLLIDEVRKLPKELGRPIDKKYEEYYRGHDHDKLEGEI